MTQRIGNLVIIAPEPDDKCSDCGKMDELRPYGPNFARVCYDCAMKDEKGTTERMNLLLFGKIKA